MILFAKQQGHHQTLKYLMMTLLAWIGGVVDTVCCGEGG
jgi:hypothetical protein